MHCVYQLTSWYQCVCNVYCAWVYIVCRIPVYVKITFGIENRIPIYIDENKFDKKKERKKRIPHRFRRLDRKTIWKLFVSLELLQK